MRVWERLVFFFFFLREQGRGGMVWPRPRAEGKGWGEGGEEEGGVQGSDA